MNDPSKFERGIDLKFVWIHFFGFRWRHWGFCGTRGLHKLAGKGMPGYYMLGPVMLKIGKDV